jgi:hypothetical protein
MSILSEILQEEYDRLNATIASYEKAASELPKGSVVKKRIDGRTYSYLQWREGQQVKSRYLKASELDEVAEKVRRRKEFEQEIKVLYASKREFDRVVGKEL